MFFLVWQIIITGLFKGLLELQQPLTDILQGKKSFKFGAEQHAAFDALKLALISALVPKVYDPE